MPSKYHFWKINNSHIQTLFGLDVNQAYYKLTKIRNAYGKSPNDDVRAFELCATEKLEIEVVAEVLGWKEKDR